MKRHICVEMKRNFNASSPNNVVIDLCLTVWLFDCPPLTNVFPCSSQNDGDDLWSRLVWASNNVCDAFWFGDGDESGQSASLNYWWRLMKTGESNYFVRCKVRCAFGRMEHILSPPPSAIRLIITVRLYHMWLFGLLLSSITEETIWGNNGPCSFPRQSIFCYFGRRFNVILHFGDKNSNFYNIFAIW